MGAAASNSMQHDLAEAAAENNKSDKNNNQINGIVPSSRPQNVLTHSSSIKQHTSSTINNPPNLENLKNNKHNNNSSDTKSCKSSKSSSRKLLLCSRFRWKKVRISKNSSVLRSRSKSITLDHGRERLKSKNNDKQQIEGAAIEYDYEDMHIQIKKINDDNVDLEQQNNNVDDKNIVNKTSLLATNSVLPKQKSFKNDLKLNSTIHAVIQEEENGCDVAILDEPQTVLADDNKVTMVLTEVVEKVEKIAEKQKLENKMSRARISEDNQNENNNEENTVKKDKKSKKVKKDKKEKIEQEKLEEQQPPKKTPELQKSPDKQASSPEPKPKPKFENDHLLDQITFQSSWRKTVKLRALYEANLIEESTVKKLLSKEIAPDDEAVVEEIFPWIDGNDPIAGILLLETGEKMSLFKAAKAGVIRRGTAVALLEAQAATGNIIDPITGRKSSIEEATALGLLDKLYESVVSRAERAVTGYKSKVAGNLNIFSAMKKKLVMDAFAMRLMEVQLATGGIIDPVHNIRTPLELAVERDLIDHNLASKLQGHGQDSEFKMFYDPNSEENVCYQELMSRCLVDEDSGLRLMPLERPANQRSKSRSRLGSQRSSAYTSRTGSLTSIPEAFKFNYGLNSAKQLSHAIAGATGYLREESAGNKVSEGSKVESASKVGSKVESNKMESKGESKVGSKVGSKIDEKEEKVQQNTAGVQNEDAQTVEKLKL